MNISGNVKITDNSDLYKKMIRKAKDDILVAIGMTAEGYAKEQSPVDTGRLRNSITHATQQHSGYTNVYSDDKGNAYSDNVGQVSEDDAVYIGSNVEYAEAQETIQMYHKTGNAHFLRNAATQHSDEYKAITKARLMAEYL